MDHQVPDTTSKILKFGKTEVTVFHSKAGPILQNQLICVLHSHMTEKPKI